MTTLDGSKEFWFQRPNDSINNVLKEFTKDLREALARQTEQTQLIFLKSLFDLITFCEEPTKNYYKIEEAKLGDLNSLNYYFHFNKEYIPETNELIKATPQLFESHEYYFTFLRGIKLMVTMLLYQPLSKPKSTKEIKPLSIAYAVWFHRNGNHLTEKIENTVKKFLVEFEGELSTVKKYVSTVSNFSITDHNRKMGNIKEALNLLRDYPNGRNGINWWSENKSDKLGEK